MDWIVRYGGEEFLIILPNTDLNGAFLAAARLCSYVSRKVIKLPEKEINITASFGISGYY